MKLSWVVPPSQGVSSGPKMTAFQCIMLEGLGEALMPSGGSYTKRL